ncbi:ankyrin repeat domain-containing protein [Flavobacterium akiainvivens]|uniref:ankyrin repeat domain-containing protein n=1 Tax=Flavobacterium akiainvivens TaxID=1202724 RepID=UPI0006C849F2|nr:ankyrin repeat domain-containing protein [Flavobacterium akiainvivens]SFQ74427.1 hypothetical protein SAMN05444144_12024 [Flavobacterium akiainvivens]
MKKLLILFLFASAIATAQDKDVFDTARRGTVAEMKALEAKNKDTLNAKNAMGFTPLILACYRGNTAVAEYLATRVNNINYSSASGTALASAAVKGETGLCEVLLKNGADPNIADANGVTPLTYAVQFENKALVALLLTYKADKKHKDNEGKTPYDHAVFGNNTEIINLLK